jgi:nucleotide-binding universal stress UspA family protein
VNRLTVPVVKPPADWAGGELAPHLRADRPSRPGQVMVWDERVFDNLLVGYDGSPGSRAALATALRLAREAGGRVTAVTVQHHLPRYGATIGEVDEERLVEQAAARRLASEVQAEADEHQMAATFRVVVGHPAHELVEAARQVGADLVVLGHSGHSAIWGALLGATTERVSRHAPCSVLIVRDPTGGH